MPEIGIANVGKLLQVDTIRVFHAKTWLTEYRKTGQEPELVESDEATTGVGELQQALYRAYRSSDHKKALSISQRLYELDAHDVGTIYNIACLHCLLGDRQRGLTWLEKAIDAGYRDADHMLSDDDLASIRETERFESLLQRIRPRASASAESRGD